MHSDNNVLAFVMAGGEGSRLHPQTTDRCKSAVPFNGNHRVVDFVPSNLVNSDIFSVYLLAQYKSQSMIERVCTAWTRPHFGPDRFATVVPPQMRNGPEWFQGTADAAYQNLHLIESFRPDIVAVFGADHIYCMDVRQMIEFHQQSQADFSVATLPVRLEQCDQFGVVEVDGQHRITDFKERPRATEPMPGSRTHALSSMGNYIFNADVPIDTLERAHATGESDFGKHILPKMVESHRLFAYDFDTNVIPGTAPYEEQGYWRDVGTIDAYFDAHFDTLGVVPKFRMTNRQWPIYASHDPSESAQIENGAINRSLVGSGCIVDGAVLDHAMLRRAVTVHPYAHPEHCIVMERSVIGRGVHSRRAIVDTDNEILVGERIGFDLAADRRRSRLTDSGIVVVPTATFRRPRSARNGGTRARSHRACRRRHWMAKARWRHWRPSPCTAALPTAMPAPAASQGVLTTTP